MKNMKKRAISLILIVLQLAAVLVSCGQKADPVDTNVTAADTGVSATETTEPAVETEEGFDRKSVDDELGSYDFNNYEFRIVTSNERTKDYFMEESTGDVVDDAIYARNLAVEERFNCKITVISDTPHKETAIITNTISGGEDAIDLICWHVMTAGGMVTKNYFMNWYDIPNVDFEKPWWSNSNVEHLTYGNFCPVAIGDFALSALSGTYCVFYNKTTGEEYNIPNMYEVVNNGKWTFDYLIGLTKDIHADLNGNNTPDEEDFFGFASDTRSNVVTYMWAFDNPIYIKNQDKLEYALNVEKTSAIAEKLLNAFTSNPGFRLGEKDAYNYGRDMFSTGKALFANGIIGDSLTHMRSMGDEYGILPYPKWDESQEEYHTVVDGNHHILAVPITVSDPEKIGTIVEALCAESYKTVVPAYYDVALKLKGTRDPESTEMLDRIVDSRVFDFGFVYDNWKGATFIMQDLMLKKSSDFASYWKGQERVVMKYYNTIIDYFANNG